MQIDLKIDAPLARITLAHGNQNVIDFAMMDELGRALGEIGERADVSVIVLSGGGANFSAGVDVPSHSPDKVEIMLTKFHAVIRQLATMKKVTIAAVRGNCLGGGAELAMVCDMVVTSKNATWGFPEIKLGCYPPVACAALAVVIGQKRAAELILTGRTFDGTQAGEYGLANHAVVEAAVESRTMAIANELQAHSPVALAHAKRALYSWDAVHFDKGLARAEEIYLQHLIQTADAQEGIRAWMEKRKPEWKGK
jgi:cyclohexa-1,5-dienecarbonyl-CoA hydratase